LICLAFSNSIPNSKPEKNPESESFITRRVLSYLASLTIHGRSGF